MAQVKKAVKDVKKPAGSPFKDYWTKQNYYALLVSFGVLIIGYIFMSMGSWDSTASLSISPVILLIAYLVLIPLSIFFKYPFKSKAESSVPGKD